MTGSDSDDDGDGINVTSSNRGSLSFTAGQSITIDASSNSGDGIYIDAGSQGNIQFVAEGTGTNSGIFITAQNNGVDHRGTQKISLTSANKNFIKTTEGDGIRLDGAGAIKLEGLNNEIRAGDNGIQVAVGTVDLIATGDNSINGSVSGVEIRENGFVNLTAERDNLIAGNKYGVNIFDGTLNINAEGNYANITSIKVASEESAIGIQVGDTEVHAGNPNKVNSNVNVYSDYFKISATGKNDSSSPTVAGIRVDHNEGLININAGADQSGKGIYIESMAQNLNTGTGSSFGVYSTNSSVRLSSAGSIDIKSVFDGHGNSTALYSGVSSINSANGSIELNAGNDIRIVASTESGSSYGIQLSYQDNAQTGFVNKISLSGKNIYIDAVSNAETGAGNANGVNVAGGEFTSVSQNSTYITAAKNSQNDEVGAYGIYAGSYASAPYNSMVKIQSQNDNLIQGGNAIYAMGEKSNISLTATQGSNQLISESAGLVTYQGSAVTLDADLGINVINSGTTGIIASDYYGIGTKSKVILKGASNAIMSSGYGMRVQSESSVELTASGNVTIEETTYSGNTFIVDAVEDDELGRLAYGIAVSSSSIVNFTAEEGDNTISVAASTGHELGSFGTGYAILNESGSTTTLTASAGQNILMGSIVSLLNSDDEMHTGVTLNAETNVVNSFSVIDDAGDLQGEEIKVISALYAQGAGSSITLNGRNFIRTYADNTNESQLERAVWAYDGADITLNGWTSISTDRYETSPNSLDIAIAAGSAINLTADDVNAPVADRAVVTIEYDTNEADGETHAISNITGDILAAYAGQVDIRAAKNSGAGINIRGNLLSGNNGILNVDLGTGGTLTGRADDYGDAGVMTESNHSELFDPAFSSALYKGGEVNLTMGEYSRWNVTGQSWITRINASNEAIGAGTPVIDLISANTDRNQNAHALTVYELSGNAVFNMSLDGDRDLSDMLYIKRAHGEYLINVYDAVTREDMYADSFDGLRFATVGKGSNVTFRAITYDQGVNNIEYEVGTDAYEGNEENHAYNGGEGGVTSAKPGSNLVDGLFDNDGTPGVSESNGAMTLANGDASDKDETGSTLDQVEETTNYKLIGRAGESTSDAGRTIINMSRANYANAVYLDTLNKRQGEMRFNVGKEDGLWARVRYDSIGKRSAFDIDNTMIEVGADSLYRKDTGEFHTGIALDYMTGDADYHGVKGDGNVDRYGAWFYTTWLGNEGEYYDFVVKYGHLENDFEIYAPTTGEKITGDYDNEVLSASLEYGKKYQNEHRWYVEPQLQVQYAYVTSDDYVTSQGSQVQLDAIHSLIGRAGVRLGKDFETEKPMTFYMRGDVLHEFLGDQDIYASDATGTLHELYENEGTWYSAGAGFSFKTSEDLYMFLEAEKVFGNANTGTYTVSGGIKYFF